MYRRLLRFAIAIEVGDGVEAVRDYLYGYDTASVVARPGGSLGTERARARRALRDRLADGLITPG